jgi:putative acetyltransferase
MVWAGLEECRYPGHEIVVLVGHTDYWPRSGLVPAKPEGLDCEFEVSEETRMVLELREGALARRRVQ